MNVLVTGATGYIGSHVCKILKEHGHFVEAWDMNVHGDHNDISGLVDRYRKLDFTTVKWYNRWIEPDVIIHLAGHAIVPISMKEPTKYYETNTMGTSFIIDLFEEHQPHIIFASSSSCFANVSPYARSKSGAEDIIREKAAGYTIFRFFNVSGTDGIHRQVAPATHLIRRAAMAACGKIDKLEIYGDDYETRDGTCIRDYVHVEDLAQAIVNAVENGPMNTPYECLGSKKGWTVKEIISIMEQVTNKKLNVEVAPRREGDSVANLVDNLSPLIKLEKTIEDMCLDQYNLERSKNYDGNLRMR